MAEKILKHIAEDQYIQDLALYSIAVNLVRALPDVKDGLKPGSRRILYTLITNLSPKAIYPHTVKSATIVGQVMGHYHPHGDSVYDTFKTMINWFECKEPLMRAQGNFGTIHGSGPSAMRYTECALNQFGLEAVIGSLYNSDSVVEWNPNFDGTTKEPQYLPVRVPLLLINGIVGGIGTGLKADLPCHNMVEVIDATLKLMDNPRADIVLIPDHCLPCDIIDTDWKSICDLGYGNYRARATIETSIDKKDFPILTITSLPTYGTESVVEKINEGVLSGKFPQIIDVNDKSNDGTGVRIVIKLKKGSDVNFVKEALYKYTPCEDSFRVNFEVVDGVDLVRLSYKQYLQRFIQFAMTNKFREYSSRLSIVRTKLHKLDAFIRVISGPDIDKIIKLIQKKSATDNELIELLIGKYKLTDKQAEYIINAAIKQLSKGYLNKYKEDAKKLHQEDSWLEDRLTNDNLIMDDVRQDLLYIRNKYGKPRICKVIKVSNTGNIPEGTFKFVVTENNYVRKLSESDPVSIVKGDRPKFIHTVSNLESVLLFDNKGRVFKLPVHKIPIVAKNDPGIDIKTTIRGLTADIVSVMYEPNIVKASKVKSKIYIGTLTKSNMIKKLDIMDFLNVPPSGIIYSKLNENDEVVSVQMINDSLDVIIYSGAKALRMSAMDIPCYKRNTVGVQAMNSRIPLEGMSVVYPDATSVVVITNTGKINRFSISGFEKSKRTKAGTNVIKLGKGDMINSIYGVKDSNIINITTTSEILNIPVKDIPLASSISPGNKIISTKSDVIIKAEII